MADDHPWIVVRIKARDMFDGEKNVARQGGEFYAPRAMIRSPRTHILRPVLLFPGYGFARHPSGQWSFLESTWGLGGVLKLGGRAARVPAGEIERLRAREGPDGLVRLEAREFQVGEKVRVEKGAISLDAIVDGMSGRDRVFVLLKLLGDSWQRAEVEVKDISR